MYNDIRLYFLRRWMWTFVQTADANAKLPIAYIRRRNVIPRGRCHIMATMEWNNESILHFLQLYKTHPCIWNSKHKLNRNRDAVSDAWAEIQRDMKVTCTIAQLKKKKESLMSAYRAYKTKIHNSTSVIGGSVYQPSWFAFGIMDSFLSSVYLCNPTPWSKILHTEVSLLSSTLGKVQWGSVLPVFCCRYTLPTYTKQILSDTHVVVSCSTAFLMFHKTSR